MPAKTTTKTKATRSEPKPKAPAAKPAPRAAAKGKSKAAATKGETVPLAEVMRVLEQAGAESTRKTYTRHGATGPMFGVAFGVLGKLQKRIRVDHELARGLWATGNVDARNLAMKIADPARIEPAELDRWALENPMRMCGLYIGSLAQESGQGASKVKAWLASKDARLRATGWVLVSVLANRDEGADEPYAGHLATIEKAIHTEANEVKAAMNGALIAIGGRTAALRKAATAAAKRIGKVVVDPGDTSCETPDAVPYMEKAWARCGTKFASPAAAERARESMRTRC